MYVPNVSTRLSISNLQRELVSKLWKQNEWWRVEFMQNHTLQLDLILPSVEYFVIKESNDFVCRVVYLITIEIFFIIIRLYIY